MSTNEPLRKIVVGLDGSEHSQHALAWAVRMAKGMGTHVIAVYAVDIPIYYPAPYGTPPQFDPGWRDAMHAEFVDKWCRPLKDAGVHYVARMEDGRAASVIAEVAEAEEADLIVVGRRGRGGFAELVLGSVSHELALHSKVAVLLVPPHG